jgi:hypothetical protein
LNSGNHLPAPIGLVVAVTPQRSTGIIERGANFRIDFERGLIAPHEIVARSRAA